MKTIAIAAVTAGGKTTAVRALQKRLPNAAALYFDDYTFEGEVEDFHRWVLDGANYQVWNLEPLKDDILKVRDSDVCDYLLLDYPFAYRHDLIRPYIDCTVFIDTPLDVALARRILRDLGSASGEAIRRDLELYLQYARIAYVQMQKDILPSSDYVVDGTMDADEIVRQIISIISAEFVL